MAVGKAIITINGTIRWRLSNVVKNYVYDKGRNFDDIVHQEQEKYVVRKAFRNI